VSQAQYLDNFTSNFPFYGLSRGYPWLFRFVIFLNRNFPFSGINLFSGGERLKRKIPKLRLESRHVLMFGPRAGRDDRINWRFSASTSITRRFLARYEIIEVGK